MKNSIEEQKEQLVKNILSMERANTRDVLKITKECIGRYGQAVSAFGIKSPVAKEVKGYAKQIRKISKIERKMFDFILHNIDSINLNQASEIVADIYDLNEQTYNEIIHRIVCIEIAANTKDLSHVEAKPMPETLLTNNEIQMRVLCLTQKLADVKNFLNFEPEFWEFIKPRLRIEPSPAYIAVHTCGLKPIKDENDNLSTFYTIIPEVVDLETGMIAVDILKRAHELYACVGKSYADALNASGRVDAELYRQEIEDEVQKRFK
jgi:hypothetical protein